MRITSAIFRSFWYIVGGSIWQGRISQSKPIYLATVIVLLGRLIVTAQTAPRPMSYSSRLVLNRAAVTKEARLEVMLLAEKGKLDEVKSAVAVVGGSVIREDPPTGYLRVAIPTERIAPLVASPNIAAYQLATNAGIEWTAEAQSEQLANVYRDVEMQPLGGGASSLKVVTKNLPFLSVPDSRAYGYTAEEETGVGEWLARHPTWDGRGVTIAVLETGGPEFLHPTLRSAKTIDGQDVPKIAGLVNTVDQRGDDFTRVEMKTVIRTARSWYTVAGRTYILPHPGAFRFGIFSASCGGNVRQEFAVLWDQKSGEIWVDCDGDASFRNNDAMRDVNERFDVGYLGVTVPEKRKIPFVVTKSTVSDALHLYPGIYGHEAMTASVAAGSRTEDSVAAGVAPNARILLVRTVASRHKASDVVEGYIEIERRPDVDVLFDETTVRPMPNMASEFYGLASRRIVAAYGKPIFHPAANGLPRMGQASALDGVFTVGGSIAPSSYEALYGGGKIDQVLKHPKSLEGPGMDGTLKPDFLAPMNRIAAKTCNEAAIFGPVALPTNHPKVMLPPCYDISNGTSSTAPYAAGVAALLISAGRQEGERFSVEALGRAMRSGAKFVPGSPAYAQGSGVLNIQATWEELHRKVDVPRITITAPLVHPMARYARQSKEGGGLLEVSGWAPGAGGERMFHLRRETGAAGPVIYRVSWTGNDGTFKAPATITLPLNQTVSLPVQIGVRSYGAHSAILNLHDRQSDAIVMRTLATIVAPEPVSNTGNHSVRFQGSVPLMRSDDRFISVPSDTEALKVELRVKRGVLYPNFGAMMTPWEELTDFTWTAPNRWNMTSGPKKMGAYTWVIPRPSAGTWSFALTNDSRWSGQDPTEEAEYELTISALKGVVATSLAGTRIALQLENRGAALIEPVADVYPGVLSSQHTDFSLTGLPNLFEVEAPENAGLLQFRIKADADSSDLEASLYNCTSGECFFFDFAGTSAREQIITVRNPKAGKWMLAVNAAPALVGHGGFVVERISAAKPLRQTLVADSKNSAAGIWQATLENPPMVPQVASDQVPVLLCELVDAAPERAKAERIATLYPEESKDKEKDNKVKQGAPPAKPVAVASSLLRLK